MVFVEVQIINFLNKCSKNLLVDTTNNGFVMVIYGNQVNFNGLVNFLMGMYDTSQKYMDKIVKIWWDSIIDGKFGKVNFFISNYKLNLGTTQWELTNGDEKFDIDNFIKFVSNLYSNISKNTIKNLIEDYYVNSQANFFNNSFNQKKIWF